MCSERLCDSERNEGASRPFKTEPRSSGRSFLILGGSVKLDAVCDAFDTILGRETHFMIFCDTFCFQMCSERLCDSERNEGASRPFKTEPRSSGRSFLILGGSVKLDAVCDAFDTILGRETHFMIFCDTFCFQMCSERLCDSERNEGASRPFKTEPRSSGRSFLILGGSVKLDAVCDAFDTILGRETHFMIFCDTFCFQMCSERLCDSERNEGASRPFKTEPRSSGRSFLILGGSVKLDAVILISHKSLFGYALCKAL
ncbi:hypothetical protein MRB53_023479 [Persea americana]|nr:hypothetical protein MRB53_023479 [Persea americana]